MMWIYFYVLGFLIASFIHVSTKTFLDWQNNRERLVNLHEVNRKRKLEEQHRRKEHEKYSTLIDANDKDLRWLLTQFELAGIKVSEWWLAGYRTYGESPPPRSACAPALQDKLDAYIKSWQ
jgi:hypothetical protein